MLPAIPAQFISTQEFPPAIKLTDLLAVILLTRMFKLAAVPISELTYLLPIEIERVRSSVTLKWLINNPVDMSNQPAVSM